MSASVRLLKDTIPQDIIKAAPQRREGVFTWRDYNAEKQEYIRTHPHATAAEIQQQCHQIAYEMGL